MMGGGFGGCTINLVKEDKAEKVAAAVSNAYREQTGKSINAYHTQITGGTAMIED